jgi:hypothetical protein
LPVFTGAPKSETVLKLKPESFQTGSALFIRFT